MKKAEDKKAEDKKTKVEEKKTEDAGEKKDTGSKKIAYLVQKGDCLWNIAKRYLGEGKRYVEIKQANGLTSNTIHPGDVLKIATEGKPAAASVRKMTEPFDPKFPIDYVYVTAPFSAEHPACDFGYNSAKGHPADQKVFSPCELRVTIAGWNDTVGYRVYATYDGDETYDWIFRFIHLSKIGVKEDALIKEGDVIGHMGNTGSSCNGAHLHLDIWKVPKGHTFVFAKDRHRYAVDPLTILRLKDGQTVSEKTDAAYTIRRGS